MKTLFRQHIQELGSAKFQLHMWIKQRKKKTDELVDLPYNSKMTEIFKGSNLDRILVKIFTYIKTQIENAPLPDIELIIECVMHLYIDFHKL